MTQLRHCDLTRKTKSPIFRRNQVFFEFLSILATGNTAADRNWKCDVACDTGPELEYLKDSKRKSQDRDKNINKKNKFKDEQKLEATIQHKQSDALPKNKVCQNFYNVIDVSVLNKYYNYEHQYRFFQKISYVIIINTAAFLKKLTRNFIIS